MLDRRLACALLVLANRLLVLGDAYDNEMGITTQSPVARHDPE